MVLSAFPSPFQAFFHDIVPLDALYLLARRYIFRLSGHFTTECTAWAFILSLPAVLIRYSIYFVSGISITAISHAIRPSTI